MVTDNNLMMVNESDNNLIETCDKCNVKLNKVAIESYSNMTVYYHAELVFRDEIYTNDKEVSLE